MQNLKNSDRIKTNPSLSRFALRTTFILAVAMGGLTHTSDTIAQDRSTGGKVAAGALAALTFNEQLKLCENFYYEYDQRFCRTAIFGRFTNLDEILWRAYTNPGTAAFLRNSQEQYFRDQRNREIEYLTQETLDKHGFHLEYH